MDVHSQTVAIGPTVDVYADEQGIATGNGSQEFAIGLVYGTEDIPLEPLKAALDARRDRNCRCVGRNRFHASKDCSPCREALATAIREHMPPLFFTTLHWDFSRARPELPHGGKLHSHILALALNKLLIHQGIQTINLRFSQVQGLSEDVLGACFRSLVAMRLDQMVKSNGATTQFPKVNVIETLPDSAGAQVADHLLWAERRVTGGTLLERAGLVQNFANQTPGPIVVRRYNSKGFISLNPHARHVGADPGELTAEQCLSLAAQIECVVHGVAKERPSQVEHLEPYWGPVSKHLRGKAEVYDEDWRNLCRAFLLLVDTLPAYGDAAPNSVQVAADAARLAAMFAAGREWRALSLGDRWRDIRSQLVLQGRGEELLGW